MKKLLLLVSALFALVACNDDDSKGTGPVTPTAGRGVFICNEGMFTNDNASLSFYDISEKTVSNNVYHNVNSVPLGDICQSMSVIDGKGFVVMNNSAKIVIIDPVTYAHLGAITGLGSPRDIRPAGNDKLYVTDLYSMQVTVVDRKTYEKTGSINLADTADLQHDPARTGNFTYITNWYSDDKIYRIDTDLDKVVDYLEITSQANSLVIDRNNKIWVLSDGGYEGSEYRYEKGALTRIDAGTFQIEQVFNFEDIAAQPMKLQINGARDRVYFLYNSWAADAGDYIPAGVYAMDITASQLPSEPVVAQGSHQFYGLGVDPVTSEIYVSDAVDFSQNGYVYRHSSSGTLVDEFRVGISPGFFCFRE